MKYRIEKDTLGEVKVPHDVYWGAQTERSRANFKIGATASMPLEIIYGFAYLKKPLPQTMMLISHNLQMTLSLLECTLLLIKKS